MQIHLNTYGTYLHVKDQLFEIKIKKEGAVEKHQLAAHKIKSIWIGEGIALSSEAVKLAMKNNIDIVFLEYDGHPIGRVWHSKLGSTTLIRKHQLIASLNAQGVQFVKCWLGQKVQNQLDYIKDLKKHRKKQEDFLNKKILQLSSLFSSIQAIEGETIDPLAEKLRGWEGTAGRLYFETLSYVLPQAYQFQGRSFRPAKDAFNAFLNYAYGVLYSKVEKALILAGIDPYVGFLHRDDYNYKSMVYDFIEPFRIHADKVVFQLFSAKKVNQGHTDSLANGIKLNKEGKMLLMNAFNAFMEEKRIRYKNRNQTRANIIQWEAHQLAQQLIQNTSTISI